MNGLGNGRPILLREDESIANARFLLTHPMRSNTDVRLVAMLELVILRTDAFDGVQKLKGGASQKTLDYLREVDQRLTKCVVATCPSGTARRGQILFLLC